MEKATDSTGLAIDRPPWPGVPWWGGVIALAVVCWLVYLPAMCGGFVLDDDILVTENPLVKAPDGLWRMWGTTEAEDYWPLTNSTFWVEWRLWGRNPIGYHLANLALHIGAALLLWAILRRLAIPGAFLAAMLFAVHPINVESVAWIAQRKNALSAFLFLASIWCYLRSGIAEGEATDRSRSWFWYGMSLAAFLLAMLSKGSVAVLPLVLLLVAWWREGGVTKAAFWSTVPYFAIAVPLVAVNVWFQTHDGEPIRTVDFAQRLAGAGAAIWFYLAKGVAPVGLAFVYPQWEIDTHELRWWIPLAAAVGVSVFLIWKRLTVWGRAILFAWAFWCVALIPVLGLVDVGFMRFALVADRYEHLAVIGLVALVGAAWATWVQHASGVGRQILIAAAVALVATFAVLSLEQSRLFGNPEALYLASLEQNPSSALVENNLGMVYLDRGQNQKAEEHLRKAIELDPRYALAHNNLGVALLGAGRTNAAKESFERAIEIRPEFAMGHENLCLALVKLGAMPEAIEHGKKAIEISPNSARTHLDFGTALVAAGRSAEAQAEFEIANRLEPAMAAAHNNMGAMLYESGRADEAIEKYRQAIRLQPEFLEARRNLAAALVKLNRVQEAVEECEQALRLNPDDLAVQKELAGVLMKANRRAEAIARLEKALGRWPDDLDMQKALGALLSDSSRSAEAIAVLQNVVRAQPNGYEAHYNLANALAKQGRVSEAIGEFEETIRLKPDFAEAHYNLSFALLGANRPDAAVEQCREAIRLRPQYAEAYANMVSALAALKRDDEAMAAARQALDLARSQGETALAERLEGWIASHAAGSADGKADSPAAKLPPPPPP